MVLYKVISSNSYCTDDNTRSVSVLLKALSDELDIYVFVYKNGLFSFLVS